MPEVPYPATIRVVCHQTVLSDEATNVFHVVVAPGFLFTNLNAQSIADAFLPLYANAASQAAPLRGIVDYRPNAAVLDKITVYDLRTVPNPVPFEFLYASAGTAGQAPFPWDVACVASLRTLVAGRTGRGRAYLGPLGGGITPGTVSAPPQWSTLFRTDVLDAFEDLNDRLDAAAGGDVIGLGVLSVKDEITRLVFQVVVDGRPDTQRRRDLQLSFPVSSRQI